MGASAETRRKLPGTIRELRESGYRVLGVREEMRKNLIGSIERGDRLFPDIIGFDDTVLPQLEIAILACQDIILLGERSQAKSRIIRSLVKLLDEHVPVVADCEINDNPFAPVCQQCKDRVAERGDEVEVHWMARQDRYGERLATPDVSVADLIGEIDPIKVGEGRHLSDELPSTSALSQGPIEAYSASTSFPTSRSAFKSACSTSWRSATYR